MSETNTKTKEQNVTINNEQNWTQQEEKSSHDEWWEEDTQWDSTDIEPDDTCPVHYRPTKRERESARDNIYSTASRVHVERRERTKQAWRYGKEK